MIIKKLIIILGLFSIYANCSNNGKQLYLKLDATKSFSPHGKIVACHWWQITGGSIVIFDNPDSIVTNLTTKEKPIAGMYIIGGYVIDELGNRSDTTLSYILPN